MTPIGNGRKRKQVEFRLINSEEMPPIVIKSHEDNIGLVIVLNQHHNVWLALHRNTIPGITESLHSKLNELCDTHLEEQLAYRRFDDE